MKLSKNLTLKEVTKSDTANRLGIDNTPEEFDIKNLRAIAEEVFQPLRDHFGVPLFVSSGFRSKKLNKAIGGSKYSQHMVGEALDIDADVYGRVTNRELFRFIKENLIFDQLIWEFGDDDTPNWVHVSYKDKGQNRKQVKRAYRDSKGVYYKVI
jgi:zinc D-Ala-D-Ala carboxypeptidase